MKIVHLVGVQKRLAWTHDLISLEEFGNHIAFDSMSHNIKVYENSTEFAQYSCILK
jgi:hypothetical protein